MKTFQEFLNESSSANHSAQAKYHERENETHREKTVDMDPKNPKFKPHNDAAKAHEEAQNAHEDAKHAATSEKGGYEKKAAQAASMTQKAKQLSLNLKNRDSGEY